MSRKRNSFRDLTVYAQSISDKISLTAKTRRSNEHRDFLCRTEAAKRLQGRGRLRGGGLACHPDHLDGASDFSRTRMGTANCRPSGPARIARRAGVGVGLRAYTARSK